MNGDGRIVTAVNNINIFLHGKNAVKSIKMVNMAVVGLHPDSIAMPLKTDTPIVKTDTSYIVLTTRVLDSMAHCRQIKVIRFNQRCQ